MAEIINTPIRKRGRKKGSPNKVPRTPASLWDFAYPGVRRNDLTYAATMIREQYDHLVHRLAERQSWGKKDQLIQSIEAWKYPHLPRSLKSCSPWRQMEKRAVAEKCIKDWLQLRHSTPDKDCVPFGVADKSEQFHPIMFAGHSNDDVCIRLVVPRLQGEFKSLQSHFGMFAQASLNCLLSGDAGSFGDLTRITKPQPRNLTNLGKNRHVLAQKTLRTVTEIYRRKLSKHTNTIPRNNDEPISWQTTSFSARNQFPISFGEVSDRVLELSQKQWVGNKEYERLRRVAQKITAAGGPIIVFD